MSFASALFARFRKSPAARLEPLEKALISLQARGLIASFSVAPEGQQPHARLQWSRGNYGLHFSIADNRRDLEVHATVLPAGPLGGQSPTREILPMGAWRKIGRAQRLTGFDKLNHLERIESIRQLETGHPAEVWLAEQIRQLANGTVPDDSALEAMILLDVGRFLKSIPNRDRLNESLGPAALTLLRKLRKFSDGASQADDEENFSKALLEKIEESHPLDLKRAALAFANG